MSDESQEKPGPDDADRGHMQRLRRERRARVAKAAVVLAIVVLLVIFVIRNSDPIDIDYVFLTRSSRLIYVLLATALLGGVVGYLLGRPAKRTRLHDEDTPKRR